MKSIFKFRLEGPNPSIDLPIGAKVLSVQSQNNAVTLWAMVDTGAQTERVNFRLVLTGETFLEPAAAVYLGTVQLSEGSFVVHVFQQKGSR